MLGIRIENIDKKAPFDVFIENMSNYTVRTFNNPEGVISVMCDMIGPRSYFYNDSSPKGLTDEENNSVANVQIKQQRIKLYMKRELVTKRNLKNIHGLVWGNLLTIYNP